MVNKKKFHVSLTRSPHSLISKSPFIYIHKNSNGKAQMNVYIKIAITAATALHWFHKNRVCDQPKNRLCIFFLLLLFYLFSVGNFFFNPWRERKEETLPNFEWSLRQKYEWSFLWLLFCARLLQQGFLIFFSSKKMQIKIFFTYLDDFHLLRSWMNISWFDLTNRNVMVGQWLECVLDFV